MKNMWEQWTRQDIIIACLCAIMRAGTCGCCATVRRRTLRAVRSTNMAFVFSNWCAFSRRPC